MEETIGDSGDSLSSASAESEVEIIRLRNCSNENIICSCGDVLSPHSLPGHLKSIRHRLNLSRLSTELNDVKKLNNIIACLIENNVNFNINYNCGNEVAIVVNFNGD